MLNPGTRLGTYEIVTALGSGGSAGGFAMCMVATLLLLIGHLTATTPSSAATEAPIVASSGLAPTAAATTPEPRATQQVPQGSIEGTVIDPQGGAVPGATVTLTSAAAATSRSTNTDSTGRFRFTGVPSGAYEVAVSLAGFKRYVVRAQLAAGQRAAINVRLELGNLSETLELRGTMPPPTPGGLNVSKPGSAYFDAAKRYYEQGRLAEAEAMTLRALEILRADIGYRPLPGQLRDVSGTDQVSGPIRVGGSIREPKKTRNVPPTYPLEAQSARVQGYVIIEAVIGKDGHVKEAKVLGGEPILADAALSAVQQWQYVPTLLNGVPVEVIMNVTVHFKLNVP